MERQIVCYKIPSFEVALARLENAALRQRPVAIAAAQTSRACVLEVSREAEQEGLYAGMPVEQARRYCPSLHILPPDPLRARAAHQHLLDVVSRFAPVAEPVRPGHLFLDLTGTTRLFGPVVDTAARIEREVTQRYRLASVAGVASNKLVSRIAADLVQPVELHEVRPGTERLFLAPLPVTLLPQLHPSSAKNILALLKDLNLKTLGELAAIPLAHLEVVFGTAASCLHQWAHGIDHSPVLPAVERPVLETAWMLDSDEVDDGRLLALLYGLLEELCRTLRRGQRVCRRLTLTLRHSDDLEVSRRHTFAAGTHWEVDMYPCLKGLFLSSFTRRVRVRRMALRAEGLEPAEVQLSLFDTETAEDWRRGRMRALSTALDHLRDRFGNRVVSWGASRDH
jgi:DNA polymerase-4